METRETIYKVENMAGGTLARNTLRNKNIGAVEAIAQQFANQQEDVVYYHAFQYVDGLLVESVQKMVPPRFGD